MTVADFPPKGPRLGAFWGRVGDVSYLISIFPGQNFADAKSKILVRVVGGEDLLGLDNEASIDGIHPGDLGYMRMADKMTPLLEKILGK
ncbi:MAG: hypothetical protein HQL31_11080 [Planctomycetes bacterium]|nr:hypothetical protein [Planctomycetota bacterium]